MRGRALLMVALQLVGFIGGLALCLTMLFLVDWRLGVAGVGAAVALAALFIDDGTPP